MAKIPVLFLPGRQTCIYNIVKVNGYRSLTHSIPHVLLIGVQKGKHAHEFTSETNEHNIVVDVFTLHSDGKLLSIDKQQ